MSPKQIKAIREALGLTQQQLADSIGADRVTVARWESGRSTPTGAYRRALEALTIKPEGKPSDALLEHLQRAIRDALKGQGPTVDDLPKQKKEGKKRGRN